MMTGRRLFAGMTRGVFAFAVVVAGCSDAEQKVDEKQPESTQERRSASELVREVVEDMGWIEGCDAARDRYFVVASEEVKVGEDAVSAATRQMVAQKAFDRAVIELARTVSCQIQSNSEDDSDGREGASGHSMRMFSEQRLSGMTLILNAESVKDETKAFEVAVGIGHSKKLESQMQVVLFGRADGEFAKPGKRSLEEWLDEHSSVVMLGGHTFVDNEGDRWLVGGVIDDGNLRTVNKRLTFG